MERRVLTFPAGGGEVGDAGAGWVYLWREADVAGPSIVYVGATRLHPVERARLHLADPDPDVGRLRIRYPAAGGDLARPLVVHAVAMDAEDRRALVKARVAWRAREAGLLSPRWCGDAPTQPVESLTPDEEACARALLSALGAS